MRILAFLVLLLPCAACYTTRAELPGTLRGDVAPAELEKVGALDVEVSHTFFIGGLVGETPAALFTKDIQKQVQARGADGVANLVYESKHGCGDVALWGCTLGCFAPRTYRLTGDIVRIRAARLPGRPAKLVHVDARVLMAQRY